MTERPGSDELPFLDDLGEQLQRAERDAQAGSAGGISARLRGAHALRGPLIAGALLLLAATGVATATGVMSSSPPPAKPLAQAIRDSLKAPAVDGVSARISFTNKLIDSSGITRGSDPVIAGSTGRLWASTNGDVRLELQSSGGGGDAQVVLKGDQIWLYHAAANTVYRATLPPESKQDAAAKNGEPWPPALAKIQRALSRISQGATLSEARPGTIAGRPAYTLRLEPKRHGGLVGGAEIAWDAVNGAPLRAAIYAKGQADPVLEIKATAVSFGPVPSSTFDIAPPAGAKVVSVDAQTAPDATDPSKPPKPVTGLAAVQAAVSFPISAPDTLAGMPRSEVRLIKGDKESGALVTYGEGLDGIAVLQTAEQPGGAPAAKPGRDSGVSLGEVTIGAVKGQKLSTPLGSGVTFARAGVRYLVLGSVIPSTAEAAARGL